MSLSLFFPTLTHTYSLTPLSVSFSLLLLVPSLSFPTLTHTYSLTPLYVSLSLSSLIPVLSFPTLTHTYSPLCLSLPLITRTQPLIPYTDTYLLPYSPLCLSLFLSSLVPSLSFPTLTHTYSLPLPCTPSKGAGDVCVAGDIPGRHDVGITLFVSHCIICCIYTHHVSNPDTTATGCTAL